MLEVFSWPDCSFVSRKELETARIELEHDSNLSCIKVPSFIAATKNSRLFAAYSGMTPLGAKSSVLGSGP